MNAQGGAERHADRAIVVLSLIGLLALYGCDVFKPTLSAPNKEIIHGRSSSR
jgi:hypothetical protein